MTCHTLLAMGKLNFQESLHRATVLLNAEEAPAGDVSLLFQAWECLKGLNEEDLPPEIRPAFSFLEHEIARAEREELSAREVGFLAGKICKLESLWSDSTRTTVNYSS